MDSKEAKALTKALQENTEALQQHTKVMTAVLKASGGRVPQPKMPLDEERKKPNPLAGLYGS